MCCVPYVSISVITCWPAVRQEHGSDWLIVGIAVIIDDADSSISFSDHDDDSQEAWGITVTMEIRMGTPTGECVLYSVQHKLEFAKCPHYSCLNHICCSKNGQNLLGMWSHDLKKKKRQILSNEWIQDLSRAVRERCEKSHTAGVILL